MYRIMIVDDEPNVLKALKRDLKRLEYEVEYYCEVSTALRRIETTVFDVVMADIRMPEIDGLTFLESVKALQPDVTRIVLSGDADVFQLLASINDIGLHRYLIKPWDAEALRSVLREACMICAERKRQRKLAEANNIVERVVLASSDGASRNAHKALLSVRRNDDGAIELGDT